MGSKAAAGSGWTRVRFGDVVENVNDQPQRSTLPLDTRYIAGEHVDENRLIIDRWGTLGDDVVPPTFRRRFQPGDVLFHSRNLKKIAVPNFSGITGEKLFVLRSTTQVLLQDFVPYVLLAPAFTAYAEASWSGSVNKFLNWTPLAKYEFALPSIDDQRRIARLCSTSSIAHDEAAKLTKHSAHMCDRLAAALITGSMDAIPTALCGQLTPDKWQSTTLGDLCTVSNGHGFRPSDWDITGYPIIRIQNVRGSDEFNYYSGEPDPKWLVHPGELLFAWAGVPGVSFGPGIWQGPVAVLNQHIYRVTPSQGVDTYWLYEVLRYLTPLIEKRAHGFKTSLLHIKKKEFTSQSVKWPGIGQVQVLSAALRRLRSIHTACGERLRATNRLRVSALQQAGSGHQ